MIALLAIGVIAPAADAKPRAKKARPAAKKPAPKKKAPPPDDDAAVVDEDDGKDKKDADASEKKAETKDVPADDTESSAEASDASASEESDDEEDTQKFSKKARKQSDLEKQDLTGHDLGTKKQENIFERDRFFVDKTDTAKTEDGTLVQGSLTSTSFGYHESGDTITPADSAVPSASNFNRLFTELRLQTDFRHIAASKWDARVDVRGRYTMDPGGNTNSPTYSLVQPNHTQSGFLGTNELEVKEAWLVRNGARSDVFIGRQFVPDLGAVKFDGLRIDYASSEKFTLLGFGGLYPVRGSRSITDDYTPLLSDPTTDGSRTSAGRFTGTGGFGAAYRTPSAYGSFGGVVIAPLSSEDPRVYATSSGYYRSGPKLDFYHFVILDIVGSNAVNAGLTNLSLGLNYKPDQRLRGTLSVNRVDTETLNVQAQAFLQDPERNINIIQNESYLQRIATNEGRASLSAGLGNLQRFEITAAATYRYRGDVTLSAPSGQVDIANAPVTPVTVTLPSASSAELYGSITDRRSVANLRLALDGSRIFRVGSAAFQRTSTTTLRVSVGRELANGHGEWNGEAAYSTNKDDSVGATCGQMDLLTCYGVSNSTVISVGGNLYYRINRDWFLLGTLFLNRIALDRTEGMTKSTDPTVTGLSGYFRIAYRF